MTFDFESKETSSGLVTSALKTRISQYELNNQRNVMDNFDRDFDRDFNRMRKGVLIYGVFVATLILAGIGFFVWVIIKTMAHFGAI